MTAIERTAYPRLKPTQYRKQELRVFEPTLDEINFMEQHNIRTEKMRLNFMVQLKTFQALHYFTQVEHVPTPIVATIRQTLDIPGTIKAIYNHDRTKLRHRNLIRAYLNIKNDTVGRDALIKTTALEVAQTQNDPANIINTVLNSLIADQYELPAFSSLDRTIGNIRQHINSDIFKQITTRLRNARKLSLLTSTLTLEDTESKTFFNDFKFLPEKVTVTHFKELIHHHNSLMGYGNMSLYLKDISKIKLVQFAEEARGLDAGHVKAMRDKNKQYSLLACLLAQAQMQAKDATTQTFMLCMHAAEKEALRLYTGDKFERSQLVTSITQFALKLTSGYEGKKTDIKKLIGHLKKSYQGYGGTDKVINDCEKILARPGTKHFIYLWKPYTSNRRNIFSFIESVSIDAIKQKQPLLKSVKLCQHLYETKFNDTWFTPKSDVDISFMPKQWQRLIFSQDKKQIHARYFELCVMLQLGEEFKNGDVYVKNADEYCNYRDSILSMRACQPFMQAFCEAANLARSGKRAVKFFKEKLVKTIHQVNRDYPSLKELVIDDKGVPTLKKRPTKVNPFAKILKKEIKARMPERNLLDILCLGQKTTHWAYSYSPLSGSQTKLVDPIAANIVTTFCYGTSMGPVETARHVKSGINARTIGKVNQSHVSLKKLNLAMAKVVDYYKTFPLIKAWGTGEAAIVDGTLVSIYDQNLLSQMHIRYGKRGGIAYHHISDTYIALFSSLIPCGVWEAVAILDGLLKNESSIKPGKVHGDTQAQSSTVFALSHLFGIRLMPRIRNWKDLTFYKPVKRMRLKNIGSLFKGECIDWRLIEDNWDDLLRTAISIQQGKVSSRLILSRLNSRNKGSTLYKAFNELGKVIRTQFLLEYISDPDMREEINAETNKVESYNNLSDWISFGSRFIAATNDTVQMEKAIKYNSLIANMVMLQNVIDMSRIIQQLKVEGWSIHKEDLARLSPYLTEHLKRFGDIVLNLNMDDRNVEKIRLESLFG